MGRAGLAHHFLNFLLEPQVATDPVPGSRTATVNGASRRLLSVQDRGLPTLYPNGESLRRGEWFTALPAAAQRLRHRLWTELKSA